MQSPSVQEKSGCSVMSNSSSSNYMADMQPSADGIHQHIKHVIATLDQYVTELKSEFNRFRTAHIQLLVSLLVNSDNLYTISQQELSFWSNVADSDAVREAAESGQEQLNSYESRLMSDREVYDIVGQIVDDASCKKELHPLFYKFLKETRRGYLRGGIELPPGKLAVVKRVDLLINNLETSFEKNIAEPYLIELGKDDLLGVPLERLEEYKQPDSTYMIPLNYPMIDLIMRNADIEAVRQRVHHVNNTKCMEQNSKILVQLLLMRNHRAQLLGFGTHAAMVQRDMMSRNPDNVARFLVDISPHFDYLFADEMRALVRMKGTGRVQPWDTTYLFNKLEKRYCAIDDSEWFEWSHVLAILFDICKRFGVHLVKREGAPTWHPSVLAFSCAQGDVYIDPFPRPGKFTHMGCFTVYNRIATYNDNLEATSHKRPLLAIVGNFTPPSPETGKCYLRLSEVETLFHEMGHVVHGLLIDVPIAALCDPETDFVEMPAQLFENLFWDPTTLAKFRHRDTGVNMDNETMRKLKRRTELQKGFQYKTQMLLAKYDLVIHSDTEFLSQLEKHSKEDRLDLAAKELTEAYEKLYNDNLACTKNRGSMFRMQYHRGTFMPSAWGHLVGYDARYYSYIWCRIFAENIYWNLIKNGGQTAINNYCVGVLAKGGSQGASKMIKALMGDDASFTTFLDKNVYLARTYLDRDDDERTETPSRSIIRAKIVQPKH
jgi:thimet oligopeptidase